MSRINSDNTGNNELFDNDEIRRRRWILNSIPYMTKSQTRDLWTNTLTDEEKESSVIVYKLLQYTHIHYIFGHNPWNYRSTNQAQERELEDLPAKFRNDSQAFIAFTKQDNFRRHYGSVCYNVPEQFRDNFNVMKAICSVCPATLKIASDRLKDNEDLVFTACFHDNDDWREMDALQHASGRIQSSKEFILKCFSEISDKFQNKDDKKTWDFDWIMHCCGFWKEESMFLIPNLTPSSFSVQDMSEFLKVLPPDKAVDAASKFPSDIFDSNEDAVFDLMKRLEPTEAEKVYRSNKRWQYKKVRSLIDPAILKQVDDENKKQADEGTADDEEEMKEKIINQISSKEITKFSEIPKMYSLMVDQDVLSKAVEYGWFDAGLESVQSLTAAMKDSSGLWEDRFECWEWSGEGECKLYSILPRQLQVDEEVAIVLLEMGCDETDLMLENIPSLVNSKRAMMAMVRVTGEALNRNGGLCEADHFLRHCPFCGDKDLMVLACNLNIDNIDVIEDHLLEDREFMERVEHPSVIAHSSDDFQINNLDLVERAIGKLDHFGVHEEAWCEDISPEVWLNRSIVIEYLKGTNDDGDHRSILKLLYDFDETNPLLLDKDLVLLSLRGNPADLEYVHDDLRCDKSFVLQCVREFERILQYAPAIVTDDDILIAAISKYDGNIVSCFDITNKRADEEFLTALLHRVKMKLQLHDMFMNQFLLGVSRDDQHTIHPSLRSPLPMLNQGSETSIKLKKKIAEYAGVPIGQSFIETKGAVAAFERFGF